MSRAFSLYLDIVRFFAALLVMMYHANWIYRPGHLLTTLGHEGVVIFFVLSGFVIAYVADTRTQNFREFMLARGARIYSVAIPAIFLTAGLDALGFWISPDVYPMEYRAWDLPVIRAITSALFVNELWTLGIQLYTNAPYWSLNYEVWYYVLFGVLFFVEGRKRIWLFALLCLFLGPKILLLMPVWWLGVWVYRSERLNNLSTVLAWCCLLVSVVGAYFYLSLDLGAIGSQWVKDVIGAQLHQQLSFSRRFPVDYLLGVLLALHFVGLRVLLRNVATIPNRLDSTVRYLAGATFSVYLLHQPLIWFYSAVFAWIEEDVERYLVVVPIVLVSCFAIAAVTERKKHLWKGWIERLLVYIEQLAARLRPSSTA